MPFALSVLLAFTAILIATTAPGGSGIEPKIIEHGPRDSNKIALTFDACPTGREDEYDEKVIEVLLKEKVPATLFLSGRWVEKNSELAKALAENPQLEIANHAYWHPHMLEKDDERIVCELKRTQDIIRKVTGKRPKYFRPPYGEVNERLAKLAAEAGLVTVQYDIASGDPDPGLSARRIIRGVVGEAKGGSIVVFHMNGNGPRTAETLPEVIKQLREKGFELVTVGAMLKGPDRGTGRRGDTGKKRTLEMATTATASVPTASLPASAETMATSGSPTIGDLRSADTATASALDK